MTRSNAGDLDQTNLALEAEWVQRARQGDSDALEKLYESYIDLIYSYFWRKSRNKADAEALTSEVFIRAIGALTRGQYQWQGKPFGAWLLSIAGHTWLEWMRKRQKERNVSLDDLSETQPLLEAQEDVLDILIVQEQHDIMWQLVRELSLVEQEILMFRYIYGLTYAEIADHLDRSEAACKQLHYRALQKLRLKMRSEL